MSAATVKSAGYSTVVVLVQNGMNAMAQNFIRIILCIHDIQCQLTVLLRHYVAIYPQ